METRLTIKFHHEQGLTPPEIFKLVKSSGVARSTVYNTINRLSETGSVAYRKWSERPRSARTPAIVKRLRARIARNPQQSQRKLSKSLGISQKSICRAIKEDLGLRPFKKRPAQGLSLAQKKMRLVRSKTLLARHATQDLDRIIFSDEKLFSVEESTNNQNVRIYAASFHDIPEELRTIQRFQYEKKVMIWCGVSKKGKLPLVFIEPGTKINAKYYKESVLESVLKPQAEILYEGSPWVFQQDSAPAHKSQHVQNWCRQNLPDFIPSTLWPPSSPDLNPLDYCIWGILQARVNATRHISIESLKAALIREWNHFPMEVVRESIDAWPRRLRSTIAKRGGRFE